MSMKKDCSCSYWSQGQQECLYSGGNYCVHNEQTPTEDRFIKVSEEFVEKWAKRWKNVDCYYEVAVREMLKEAGVEIDE